MDQSAARRADDEPDALLPIDWFTIVLLVVVFGTLALVLVLRWAKGLLWGD